MLNMQPDAKTFKALKNLTDNSDFETVMTFIKKELEILREESDNLPDQQNNLISQGQRQALKELIRLSSKEAVEAAFKTMRADADLAIPDEAES